MKQLIIITASTLSIAFFSACSSSSQAAPSQNSALNSISNSGQNSKSGYMQKSLDSWLKDDWTPTVNEDKDIQEKYMKKSEPSQKETKISTSDTKDDTTIISKDNIKKENSESEYEEDNDRPFTLQEYVDKAAAYMKAKPNDYENSNVKKLDSMPVIGN